LEENVIKGKNQIKEDVEEHTLHKVPQIRGKAKKAGSQNTPGRRDAEVKSNKSHPLHYSPWSAAENSHMPHSVLIDNCNILNCLKPLQRFKTFNLREKD
jgi:hypothetical protein